MRETIEDRPRRSLQRRHDGEHRFAITIGVKAPLPAEDALTILAKDFHAVIVIRIKPRRVHHAPVSLSLSIDWLSFLVPFTEPAGPKRPIPRFWLLGFD